MHHGATGLVLVEAERRMEENRGRDRSRDEENRKEAFPFLVFGRVIRIQLIEPILNLPPSIAESSIAIGFVQRTTSQGSILCRESLQSSLCAPRLGDRDQLTAGANLLSRECRQPSINQPGYQACIEHGESSALLGTEARFRNRRKLAPNGHRRLSFPPFHLLLTLDERGLGFIQRVGFWRQRRHLPGPEAAAGATRGRSGNARRAHCRHCKKRAYGLRQPAARSTAPIVGSTAFQHWPTSGRDLYEPDEKSCSWAWWSCRPCLRNRSSSDTSP